MHVALVSCGPSASAFPGHDGTVICISKQAAFVPCDWWACFDYPVLRRVTPIGTPRLFTLRDTRETLLRRKHPFAASALVAETLACPVPKWTLYTAPAALVLAHSLGAQVIDCWGVDMTGTGDATGDAGEDRSEARWERERGLWDAITGWLGGEGVEVIRHGHP